MKITIIVDKALPNGLAANTAAVLGISLGKMHPEMVRETVCDASGNKYSGITSYVIPILAAEKQTIKEIVQKVRKDPDVTLIPFTSLAQESKDYDAYKAHLLKTYPDLIEYSGIALVGSNKKVSAYTGSLPLFR